jgi:acyl-CoA thioesterase-1
MDGSRRAVLAAALFLLSGCAVRDAACTAVRQVTQTPEDLEQSADPTAALDPTRPGSGGAFTIVLLGDSLTAGIGLRTEDAYPALVQKAFAANGYHVDVVDASLIGQTTADGVRQLDAVLQPGVRILLVALGSHDALRGIGLDQTRENLTTIIDAAQARGVTVVLAGMEPPTTVGQDYQQAFRGIYVRLANSYRDSVAFVPSLLEGVLGNPALNQADGLRPNAEGARVIAQHVFGRLQVVVDGMGGGS